MGFRSLHDVSMTLYCKFWWKFCNKTHTGTWIRENIIYGGILGNTQVWYDNWTGFGALYYATPNISCDERIQNVNELQINEEWNKEKLT
ncbi:hypothetical protein H5410_026949 [Solanum commersonii]|uniref:Uncharacterized protein n=1 Tax=Solanum commersonii TaxID=4109 RepID=A0A9J5YXX2_SOLCO|nr:hypothetical protein H5410_026949 [Solanum commersonii]